MAISLDILNNVPSLFAQQSLNKNSVGLQKSLEHLSTGLRVIRGADGPADLVVSERLRTQTASLNAAIANSDKDVSVAQIAEGGLDTINQLLTRARALALSSANTATNDAATFTANQNELNNILDTIDRVSDNTQYGTKKLLDGSSGVGGIASDTDVTFLSATVDGGPPQSTTGGALAGTYAVAVVTAGTRGVENAGVAQTTTLAANENLTVNGVVIALFAGQTRDDVKASINAFTSQTGVIATDGAAVNITRLQTIGFGTLSTVSVVSDTAAAVNTTGFGTATLTSTGVDVVGTINAVAYTGRGSILTANTGAGNEVGVSVNFAANGTGTANISTVNGAQGNVVVQDNTLVFQVGAQAGQTDSLSIAKLNSASLGLETFQSGNPPVNGVAQRQQFFNLRSIQITSRTAANDSLVLIDNAITTISSLRGQIGAIQHDSLEANADNLRLQVSNQVAADSVIRDTDYASEISSFTRYQVLVQAGTSVLGNANAVPQLALTLLSG